MTSKFVVTFMVLFPFFIISCGRGPTENGNLDPKLTQLLQEFGARLSATKDIPPLIGNWTVKKDKNGFQVEVRNMNYDTVEAALFKIFSDKGERFRPVGRARSCLFKASEVGVALTAVDETDQVRINCLRGMTSSPLLIH